MPPILVFATLFGVVLSHIGSSAKPVIDFLDSFVHGVFSVVVMIVRLAPLLLRSARWRSR